MPEDSTTDSRRRARLHSYYYASWYLARDFFVNLAPFVAFLIFLDLVQDVASHDSLRDCLAATSAYRLPPDPERVVGKCLQEAAVGHPLSLKAAFEQAGDSWAPNLLLVAAVLLVGHFVAEINARMTRLLDWAVRGVGRWLDRSGEGKGTEEGEVRELAEGEAKEPRKKERWWLQKPVGFLSNYRCYDCYYRRVKKTINHLYETLLEDPGNTSRISVRKDERLQQKVDALLTYLTPFHRSGYAGVHRRYAAIGMLSQLLCYSTYGLILAYSEQIPMGVGVRMALWGLLIVALVGRHYHLQQAVQHEIHFILGTAALARDDLKLAGLPEDDSAG